MSYIVNYLDILLLLLCSKVVTHFETEVYWLDCDAFELSSGGRMKSRLVVVLKVSTSKLYRFAVRAYSLHFETDLISMRSLYLNRLECSQERTIGSMDVNKPTLD